MGSDANRALYLKYRPQKFADLDVAEVRDYFLGMLTSGKVAHAYLFTGPRGTGKTSAARILAKAVNCEKNKKLAEPCGECAACREIVAGSAMDVIEIDAASNRGIDDVRELREKVKLAPVSLEYKVFIIDECHMLTTEAANALLKTLEEPPDKTIFVLCTTEDHKILPTVASRCTKVVFRKARPREIVEKLEKICKEEKIKISQSSLELVSVAGSGSFRDAVKILEQVISSGKLSDKEIEEQLGRQESASSRKLLAAMLDYDLKGSLDEVARITELGVPPRVFVEGALEILRDWILHKSGIENDAKIPDGVATLTLLDLTRKIERAGRETKDAFVASLPLELLVVEWCSSDSTRQDPLKEENDVQKQVVQAIPIVATLPNLSSLPSESTQTRADVAPVSLVDIEAKWTDLLKEVRPKNYSIEALLRSAKPISIEGNNLVLEVFYKFHKERLETDKCRRVIEESMVNLFGGNMRLIYRLGEKPKVESRGDNAVIENISGKGVDDEILKAAEEIFGVEAI